MKKINKINKNINEIKYSVLKYFHSLPSNKFKLPIIGKETRIYKGYDKEFYKAVTINYLYDKLLNKKYSKAIVTYAILELFKEREIKSFRCSDIGEVIFTCYKPYGTLIFENVYEKSSYKEYLKKYYMIKSIFKE